MRFSSSSSSSSFNLASFIILMVFCFLCSYYIIRVYILSNWDGDSLLRLSAEGDLSSSSLSLCTTLLNFPLSGTLESPYFLFFNLLSFSLFLLFLLISVSKYRFDYPFCLELERSSSDERPKDRSLFERLPALLAVA